MNDAKYREARLHRLYGMLPEDRERIAKVHGEAEDWYTKCRHCGETLTGTLASIKEHKCHAGASPS